MRLHISLDDTLVAELDQRVGRRRRSAFLAAALRSALEDERRWEDIEAALGALDDGIDDGHPWDDDAADWVRRQRGADSRRVG